MKKALFIFAFFITLISCHPDNSLTWHTDNITYNIQDSTILVMRFDDGSVNKDTITMTDSSGLKIIRFHDPLLYDGEYYIITKDGSLIAINKENKVFQNIPK
jgi:uncharacterized protein YxjI